MGNKKEKNSMKLKSILKPKVARHLIKMGFIVKDIKPFKENTDRTIFLFEETEKLLSELTRLNGVE
jgi:hypothetical protein